MERILPDIRHNAQRERDDAVPGNLAEHEHCKAEHGHAGERPERRAERRVAVRRTIGERVDDAPGVNGDEDVGEGREDDRRGDPERERGLLPPMAEGEGKHGSNRIGARPAALWRHGVFPAKAPVHLSGARIPEGLRLRRENRNR